MLAQLPKESAYRIQWHFREGTARNLQIHGELRQITEKLNQRNIPIIVLKGAYLAHTVYPSASLRTMADCDILIREEDLPTAVEVLNQLDYQTSKPIQLWDKSVSHHLPPFRKEAVRSDLELHWTIIPPKHPQKIDIADLWERAQPYPVGGANALAFCPEDMLLHIIVHASYHNLFNQGCRPLVDIARLVEHFDSKQISNKTENDMDTAKRSINWQTVCERSHQWNCAKGTYLMLYLTKTLLNANIPTHILETLKPDTLPAEAIELAKICVFTGEDDNISDNINFMQIMGEQPLKEKAQLFFRRFFISPKELAYKYGVSEDSFWLYCYYPRRFWDFLSHISKQLWNFLSGTNTFKQETEKRMELINWMVKT